MNSLQDKQAAVIKMWGSLNLQNRMSDERFVHGATIVLMDAYAWPETDYPTTRTELVDVYSLAVRNGFVDC